MRPYAFAGFSVAGHGAVHVLPDASILSPSPGKSQVYLLFTSTKVQILPNASVHSLSRQVNPKFTCFTSTTVQILTQKRLAGGSRADEVALQRPLVYLLYWYNITNTDAEAAGRRQQSKRSGAATAFVC